MTDINELLKKQAVIAALCYFALGLLFVLMPGITANAIAVLISLALLALGVVKIIIFFARRSAGAPDRSSLPMGVILAISAAAFLIKPALLVSVVYALLGLALAFNGALKLQTAIELRRGANPYWGSVALAAIAAITLGAIAIFAPFKSAKAVILLVGVSMICLALFDLVSALFFMKESD